MNQKTVFNIQNLAEMMRRVPHFVGLSLGDLKKIIEAGKVVRFDAEENLFWENEPCAGLFVLLRGQIHLYKFGPQGQENIMAVIRPVTMFNEVSTLDGGTNPATAAAYSKSTIWHISRENFQELLKEYPQFAYGLLTVLAKRNRRLVSLYEDLSFLSVRARTAKLLLELSENGEKDIDRRKHTIQEMAARISTSPEVVSRTISLLTANGFLESSRQTIKIVNVEALAKLAYIEPDFAGD